MMKKILIYNSFSNMMPELIVWMIYLQNFGWHIAEIAILQGVFTFFQRYLNFHQELLLIR